MTVRPTRRWFIKGMAAMAAAAAAVPVHSGRSPGLRVLHGLAAGATGVSPPAFRIVLPGLSSDPGAPPGASSNEAWDPLSRRSLAVIPREAWGAGESLRFRDDGSEAWREMFIPARVLIVHHTGTRNSYRSFEEAAAEVRSVYNHHAIERGWADIGYTALIDRFGNIYEGRHGRGGDPGDTRPRELLSSGVSGGHTKEYEYGSAGVALLGDSTLDDWEMTPEMWDALVRFSVFECGRSFLRPLAPGIPEGGAGVAAVSDFLRTDGEWHDGALNIGGHINFSQTFCPGEPVLGLLPALRIAVHEGLAGTSRTGVPAWLSAPANREVLPGARVGWEWAAEPPEAGWSLAGYEYAIEGWYKPADSDDVEYLSGYTPEHQPELAFNAAGPEVSSVSFVPTRPGQYTLHVRALLTGARALRRAAFEGRSTVLVASPPGE